MPANQIRVLQSQLQELGVWLGNVFVGTLGKILPYINGFVMALKEIIKVLAIFVGYDGAGSIADPIQVGEQASSGIASNLGSASKSAKEIKKSLMGFDVLNVIQSPSDTSGGGGAGGVGPIDPAILNALSQYDSMMADVRMKATDIRNRILEWLGFTLELDEKGRLIGIHLKDGYTNIEKIRDALAIIMGFAILSKVVKIAKTLSGIGTAISSSTVLTDISFAISAMAGGAATAKEAIGLVAASIGKALAPLAGVIGIIAGVILTIKGVFEILNGETFDGIIHAIEGIAIALTGVFLLAGAWIPALIAAAVAAVAAIVKVIVDNWDAIKKFFSDVWNAVYDTVIGPIVDFISKAASWIYNTLIKPVIDFFKPIYQAVVDMLKLIIDKVVEIVTGIGEAIWSIVTKVWEIFAKIVEIFVALGKAFYDFAIKPILEWLGKIAGWVYDNVLKPIGKFFKNVGTWIYDNVIKPIWDKILWLRDKAVDIFTKIGTTVVNFVSGAFKGVINGILSAVERTINNFIRMLNGAITLINKIPGVNITKVSLLSIPRLATGGLVDAGQMFIAREAGPELVGKIGNSNAVMNNNQIVESVSRGVAEAVSGVMGRNGGSYNFYLDGKELTATVVERMRREANISGMGVY